MTIQRKSGVECRHARLRICTVGDTAQTSVGKPSRSGALPLPTNTRAEARRLFPNWPRRRQAKWVIARLLANRVPPRFAKMLPMTEAAAREDRVLDPRTMREAGFP